MMQHKLATVKHYYASFMPVMSAIVRPSASSFVFIVFTLPPISLSLSLSLSHSLIVAVLLQGFSAATQKEKDKEEREIQIADRLANQMDDLNPLLAQLI